MLQLTCSQVLETLRTIKLDTVEWNQLMRRFPPMNLLPMKRAIFCKVSHDKENAQPTAEDVQSEVEALNKIFVLDAVSLQQVCDTCSCEMPLFIFCR
jgi:hypothetical protein